MLFSGAAGEHDRHCAWPLRLGGARAARACTSVRPVRLDLRGELAQGQPRAEHVLAAAMGRSSGWAASTTTRKESSSRCSRPWPSKPSWPGRIMNIPGTPAVRPLGQLPRTGSEPTTTGRTSTNQFLRRLRPGRLQVHRHPGRPPLACAGATTTNSAPNRCGASVSRRRPAPEHRRHRHHGDPGRPGFLHPAGRRDRRGGEPWPRDPGVVPGGVLGNGITFTPDGFIPLLRRELVGGHRHGRHPMGSRQGHDDVCPLQPRL